MKKRVVSLLLALVMLTSLVPTTAWAEMAEAAAEPTAAQPLPADKLSTEPEPAAVQPLTADESFAETGEGAGEPAFEDFFAAWDAYADVRNDTKYPFTVAEHGEQGYCLKSGNGSSSDTRTRSTLTVTVRKAAALTFTYQLDGQRASGLEVKNGTKTLYTYSQYGSSGATQAYGDMQGTATVQANAGDTVTISYYRGPYSGGNNCMWLSNFAATEPAQVIFHANDGTDATAQQGVFGTGSLQANPFIRDGYRFKGWATTPDGEIVYKDKSNITITGDTDLYAVWANVYTVTFAVTPADAVFNLYSDAERTVPVTPDSGTVYTLENGTYYYAAELFGYKDAADSVVVSGRDENVTISLAPSPSATVRFTYAEDAAPTIKVAYIESKWNKVPMSAAADGSYLLPVDYKYEWTFDSAKYVAQSGEIDLNGVEAGSTQTVKIPTSPKPAGSGSAEDPYRITNADQLRWFAAQVNDNSKSTICAQLTDDIDLESKEWTPIGKNYSYAYKGTFDGQKHTVSGLFISGSASQNCGLFGYVEKGTVKDLTVQGTITLTGSGGSSYGAGGIVGQLSGTEGSVRNCRSDVTITGGQNVGGIVGYVSSGYSTATKSITGCVNTGRITSNSNNAGGIVGYISGQVTVDSCYNRGTVAGGGWRAGGITAYLSSSNAVIKNCYTTGAVTGKDSAAVVGKKSSGSISGCYYLNTLGTDSNATAKTSDELKALASTLGELFMSAPEGKNDGYPILKWQVPTYEVAFHTGAGASITVNGVSGQADADGKYTVKLPDGAYEYTVSAFGYADKTDSVTVNGKAQTVTVTLTAVEQRTVRFNITPADAGAAVTVTWDGDGRTVAAQSDGSYRLPEGAYTYTVKAKGYAKDGGPLNVTKDETISVTLTPSAAWDGETRDEKPSGEGTEVAPYQIGSGAELAWLANAVNNASSGTKFYVELTDDIDLGNQPWTPIGKFGYSSSDRSFSGSFRGNGHTVKGLNASAEYAGLFGSINDAEITGVVVQGIVASTDAKSGDAGGIVGRAIGTTNKIINCGNEAAVSGGCNVGGILGNNQAYNTKITVLNCYNMGHISASDRAGGIVGRCGGSSLSVTNCYNTGEITSNNYAAGVIAGSNFGWTVSSCYNTGKISSKNTSNIGAFTTSDNDAASNSFYLEGSIPAGAKTSGATAMSDAAMRTELPDKLGAGNWKTVRGVNNGYPVLSWQTDETPAAVVTMAKNIRFAREEFDTDDGDVASLPIGLLLWDAAEGKTYTVTLWQMVRSWTPLDADGLAEYDAITGEYTGFPSLEKLEYVNTTAVIGRMSEEQRTQLAKLDAAVEAAENDPKDVTGEGLYQAMERRAAFIVSLAGTEDLGAYESQLTFVEDISNVSAGKYDLSGRFAGRGERWPAGVLRHKDGGGRDRRRSGALQPHDGGDRPPLGEDDGQVERPGELQRRLSN